MRFVFNLLFLLFAFSAYAQTDTLSADELPEMVISASRQSELKTDIPNEIDIISKLQIEAASPLTSADALEASGNVYVQRSQQGGGSPVIRGFEANRVLLVIDGVRMNNAIYRSGHLQNSITTDPSMMERIEVFQGAGSVVHGTDAIGGVVSFFTRDPKRSLTGKPQYTTQAYARYATANQGKTLHADVEAGFKNWASLTGISVSKFGDVLMGKNDLKDYPEFGLRTWSAQRINGVDSLVANPNPRIQLGSAYEQVDALQKFILDNGGKNRHEINIQYSNSTNVPRYDRLSQLKNGKPRSAEWNYGPQTRLMAAYSWVFSDKKRLFDGFSLTSAFQYIQESRITRDFGSSNRFTQQENLGAYSLNGDFFKNIKNHELRYGAEIVHNSLESIGSNDNIETAQIQPSVSRYPSGTYSTFGLFASHRWELAHRKLILSDGLRLSGVALDANFDPRFFTLENLDQLEQKSLALNWNLGAVYEMKYDWRINAIASTGFRNPNIDDAGKTFETNDGGLIVPNANAKPEKIFYKELGLQKSFGNKSSISISAFHSQLTDALVRRPYKVNNQDSLLYLGNTYATYANINIGEARVWGFSLDAKIRTYSNWTFVAALNYTKGKDLTDDQPLSHIPPLYGRGQILYKAKKWEVDATCLFNAWKKLKDYSIIASEDNLDYATPNGTPAWARVDVRGKYELSKHWSIQCTLQNVGDQNYRTFASGINAPGRNVVLSVFCKF